MTHHVGGILPTVQGSGVARARAGLGTVTRRDEARRDLLLPNPSVSSAHGTHIKLQRSIGDLCMIGKMDTDKHERSGKAPALLSEEHHLK
jgi:hypothetical protein